MQKKAFIIFGDSFSFPEGTASTNRVFTFAKGFSENGIDAHVICFQNEYLESYNGTISGIKYYHPLGRTKRSNSFVIRNWQKILKHIRTISLIRNIKKEEDIIAIDLFTYSLLTHLHIFLIARLFRIKLIFDRCEHPMQFYTDNIFSQTSAKMRLALEAKLCDAMFCISDYLIDFYNKKGFDRQNLFLVPSTVDTERFSTPVESILPFNYILYCGSLTILKDGVDILVKSFAKISSKYPEINLVLIGKGDTIEEETSIRELVAELKIDNRIIFLGQLSRSLIPVYLINAKVLALARPASIQAAAGFPSKLTEYLSTGNPIVVTNVGEIPLYLKDNENAFLSEPGDIDAFSGKLDFVLDNYEIARKVGNKGKELTTTVFNYNYQSKRMISFIDSLRRK
jgi:glycosyltransferase involved in cell wall biosynthesis